MRRPAAHIARFFSTRVLRAVVAAKVSCALRRALASWPSVSTPKSTRPETFPLQGALWRVALNKGLWPVFPRGLL